MRLPEVNMSERHDLLVSFNERSNCIELFSTDSHSSKDGQEFPKPHLKMELQKLVAMTPDEAERRIGALVLSFLDFYSGSRIKVRDYQEIGREYSPPVAQLTGAGEAEFMLAMRHIDACLTSRSAHDLETAEKYLVEAIAAGSVEAKLFFDTEWARTKALALRRIADQG